MSLLTEPVVDAALALPAEQRAALADKLLTSLDPPAQKEIDAAWLAAVERRLQEHAAGKMAAIPAEEVFRLLRARNR